MTPNTRQRIKTLIAKLQRADRALAAGDGELPEELTARVVLDVAAADKKFGKLADQLEQAARGESG